MKRFLAWNNNSEPLCPAIAATPPTISSLPFSTFFNKSNFEYSTSIPSTFNQSTNIDFDSAQFTALSDTDSTILSPSPIRLTAAVPGGISPAAVGAQQPISSLFELNDLNNQNNNVNNRDLIAQLAVTAQQPTQPSPILSTTPQSRQLKQIDGFLNSLINTNHSPLGSNSSNQSSTNSLISLLKSSNHPSSSSIMSLGDYKNDDQKDEKKINENNTTILNYFDEGQESRNVNNKSSEAFNTQNVDSPMQQQNINREQSQLNKETVEEGQTLLKKLTPPSSHNPSTFVCGDPSQQQQHTLLAAVAQISAEVVAAAANNNKTTTINVLLQPNTNNNNSQHTSSLLPSPNTTPQHHLSYSKHFDPQQNLQRRESTANNLAAMVVAAATNQLLNSQANCSSSTFTNLSSSQINQPSNKFIYSSDSSTTATNKQEEANLSSLSSSSFYPKNPQHYQNLQEQQRQLQQQLTNTFCISVASTSALAAVVGNVAAAAAAKPLLKPIPSGILDTNSAQTILEQTSPTSAFQVVAAAAAAVQQQKQQLYQQQQLNNNQTSDLLLHSKLGFLPNFLPQILPTSNQNSPQMLNNNNPNCKPIPNNDERVDLLRFKLKEPQEWGADDVVAWILDVARRHQIPCENLNMHKFAKCTGSLLTLMNENSFRDFDPCYGQLLYGEFRKLLTDDNFMDDWMQIYKNTNTRRNSFSLGISNNFVNQTTGLNKETTQIHFNGDRNAQILPQQQNINLLAAAVAAAVASPLNHHLNQQHQQNHHIATHNFQQQHQIQEQQQQQQNDNYMNGKRQHKMLQQHYNDDNNRVSNKFVKLNGGQKVSKQPRQTGDYLENAQPCSSYTTSAEMPSTDANNVSVIDENGQCVKVRKNKDGKPRKRSQHTKGNKLWEFIREALKNPNTCPSIVRTYYEKLILVPVPKTGLYPKKLVYKFGPTAHGWNS